MHGLSRAQNGLGRHEIGIRPYFPSGLRPEARAIYGVRCWRRMDRADDASACNNVDVFVAFATSSS